MQRITIDLVSDVVCPWCYLGKARLDLAIAEVQDTVSIDVNWRPYRLNPDYPPEGVDQQAELAKNLAARKTSSAAISNWRSLAARLVLPSISKPSRSAPIRWMRIG